MKIKKISKEIKKGLQVAAKEGYRLTKKGFKVRVKEFKKRQKKKRFATSQKFNQAMFGKDSLFV